MHGQQNVKKNVSDVPKVAVFRDASRDTNGVHHAKYLYLSLHRSRNIAADIGNTKEIHILRLYKFLVLSIASTPLLYCS